MEVNQPAKPTAIYTPNTQPATTATASETERAESKGREERVDGPASTEVAETVITIKKKRISSVILILIILS